MPTIMKYQGGKGVVRGAWFGQKFSRDAWNQPKSGRDPWIIGLAWRVIGLVWGPWYVIQAELYVKIKILVNPFIIKQIKIDIDIEQQPVLTHMAIHCHVCRLRPCM